MTNIYYGPSPQAPFLSPNYKTRGSENLAVKNKQTKKYFICLTQPLPKLLNCGPDPCGSVGWMLSHKAKDRRFDSPSGRTPGLWVWSLVRAHVRGNCCFSLTLMFLSLSFSLPPPPYKDK